MNEITSNKCEHGEVVILHSFEDMIIVACTAENCHADGFVLEEDLPELVRWSEND